MSEMCTLLHQLGPDDVSITLIPNGARLTKRSVYCGWVLVGVGGGRHGEDVKEVG
jgi:hypothetical protein